jgi:hypothetical protein
MAAGICSIYCDSIRCNHGTKINADHLPDETPIRPIGRRGTARLVATHGTPLQSPHGAVMSRGPSLRRVCSSFMVEKHAVSAHKCGMHSIFPYALWTLIAFMVIGSGLAILVW